MRCGGVLRVTYLMLLERMATAPVAPPAVSILPTSPAERFRRTSSSTYGGGGGGGEDADNSSERAAEMAANAAETLAELEAQRKRAEEGARAIEAEAELAAEQLLQYQSAIVAAESARETAERAADADRAQCEQVEDRLSSIRERVEQLDADFQQRIRDAAAVETEREAATAAAAAAEDAATAAAAASLMERVAKLEASIALTGEELELATAHRRAAKAEEMRARDEEAELRKTIGDLKLQQERDERDAAEQELELAREQRKRDELAEQTSELDIQRGRVDSELEQLRLRNPTPGRKVGKSAAEVGGTSTDPNGIEALVGEDEVSYIRRQQKLQQEAKERMAAKFGGNGVGQEHRQRMASISSTCSSSSTEVATIVTLGTEPAPVPRSRSPGSGSRSSSGRNSPTLPPTSGRLRVLVVACNNILAADASGRSDPFIKLRLGDKELSTTVCQKTLNPVFNETLILPIDVSKHTMELGVGPALSSDTFLLRVEVWDKDRHSRDDFLGECSVHLLDLFAGVWSGERHVHRAFGDPQHRLSIRERKQAKRRGGAQPYGAVDLRCSFEAGTELPSLAEWLAERDLAVFIQRVADAMTKADIPDEDAVPMLDGMDDLELKQFIDACRGDTCAQSVASEQHETIAASPDAAESPDDPSSTGTSGPKFVDLGDYTEQPQTRGSKSMSDGHHGAQLDVPPPTHGTTDHAATTADNSRLGTIDSAGTSSNVFDAVAAEEYSSTPHDHQAITGGFVDDDDESDFGGDDDNFGVLLDDEG